MRLVYLPALSRDAFRSEWARTPLNWMDPRLRGTTAYHPYGLASYAYWGKQRFGWEPEDVIFGDSGGYSVLTRGLIIDPRRVIRWQLRHCDLGVILDTPPGRPNNRWRACLTRTVTATKAALPIYLAGLDAGTSFRWWGVVHGRTTDELEEWWATISRVYPFRAEGEGWAFKPYPLNNLVAIARLLKFIGDKGITNAHFFKTSARNSVETLCCLGPRAGLEYVTFDTRSATEHGIYRKPLVRTPYGWEVLRERYHKTGARAAVRRYLVEKCQCVSCNLLRVDLEEHAELIEDAYWMYRIIFHNVLVMNDEFAALRRRYGVDGGRAGQPSSRGELRTV